VESLDLNNVPFVSYSMIADLSFHTAKFLATNSLALSHFLAEAESLDLIKTPSAAKLLTNSSLALSHFLAEAESLDLIKLPSAAVSSPFL
jgi:hypothetical protein